MDLENYFLPATQTNYKYFWEKETKLLWLCTNKNENTLIEIGHGIYNPEQIKPVLEEYILTQTGLN